MRTLGIHNYPNHQPKQTTQNKMKMKRLVLLSAGIMAIISTACEKSEYNISPDNLNATINASINDQTRSVVSDLSFYWSKNDQIDVWYSNATATTKRIFTYSGNENVPSATFTGTIADGESCSGYAVYPSGSHTLTDGAITVNMPATYGDATTDYAPNTNAAMITIPADGASAASTESNAAAPSLSFKHVGGVLAFTIKKVPAEAAQFVFTANMPVTGDFTVADGKITSTEPTSGSTPTNNVVTIKFKALTAEAEAMTFYVPLPTGTYNGYKAEVKNADGSQTYMSFESGSSNTLNRAGLASVTLVITDINAGTPAQEVSTPAQLENAIANGGSYILTNDITTSSLNVPAGKTSVIDLGGKVLNLGTAMSVSQTYALTKSGEATIEHGIVNNGTLTINNGNIVYNTGSTDFNVNAKKHALYNKGVLSLTKTSITSNAGVIYTEGTWTNNVTLENQGTPAVTTTIDGGEYLSTNTGHGTNGEHLYAFNTVDNALLTVTGGASIKGDGSVRVNCSKLNADNATLIATCNSGHSLWIAGAGEISTTNNTTFTAPGAKVVAYSGSNAKYGIINYNNNKLNSKDGISVPSGVVVKLVNENAAPTITGQIINRGTLFISGGSVNYTASGSTFAELNKESAIKNYGVLTLEQTNVTSNTRAIYNYGTWTNDATLENQGEITVKASITGGTITSNCTSHSDTGVHTYALSTDDNASLTITGTTISGDGGISVNCSNLKVSNSNITANCANNCTYGIYAISAANVTASGNTISATSNNKVFLHKNKDIYGNLIYNTTEYTVNTFINDSNNY